MNDDSLIANVTFTDAERLFSEVSGAGERICLVIPLAEGTPGINLKLIRDGEGMVYALMIVHEGMARIKPDSPGRSGINVSALVPVDKEGEAANLPTIVQIE